MPGSTWMTAAEQMANSYFQPLVVNGDLIDLDHLQPFTFVIESRLAKKNLRVHVTYSTHCFSEKFDAAIHDLADAVIDPQTPRPRVFCPIRYRLSHDLPKVIAGWNHPKATVWETAAYRNWAYSMTIKDPNGPYHVFFEVRRAPQNQRQWQDLNLVIESAYHETEEPPALLGSMGFLLLCGKVYMGQPTATRR